MDRYLEKKHVKHRRELKFARAALAQEPVELNAKDIRYLKEGSRLLELPLLNTKHLSGFIFVSRILIEPRLNPKNFKGVLGCLETGIYAGISNKTSIFQIITYRKAES